MAGEDQIPLNTGIDMHTPAAEIVKGKDLSGKTAIVTGGYSGIGIETTRALVDVGANVIVPARRPEVAADALAQVSGQIEVASMDLADLSSIRTFADHFLSTSRPLHLLINNAGIMANPLTRVGPGWESQFGTNHLGHMALAQKLLPALRQADGARVVALSSTAHVITDVHWDDPHFNTHEYDKWQAYGQAKTANALFARHLNMLEKDNGIEAFGVHPGGIFTPLQRHLSDEEMVFLGWKNADGTIPEPVQKMFKSPEAGASTTVWAATADALAGHGGVYCENCDIAALGDADTPRFLKVRAHACDPEGAARLWAMSEDMLANA